jgi:hypothetical protein
MTDEIDEMDEFLDLVGEEFVEPITFTYGSSIIWATGNGGGGSGLDADLLDGQQATSYQSATNLATGSLTLRATSLKIVND